MKTFKLLLAAIGATALAGALVSSASARNFSLSHQTFRGAFREVRLVLAFGTVNCQMTLEGSLHARTMPKVAGSLIGYVTRAILGPCASGTTTILTETLPWHLRYRSFTGTLPNIGRFSADIINMGIAAREPGGIRCLVRTTVRDFLVWAFWFAVSRGTLVGAIPSGPECIGGTVNASSDEGPVMVLGSTTVITLTLI